MDAAVTTPAWVNARTKQVLKKRPAKIANIFAGSSAWEQATVAGLEITRLSVSPSKSTKIPASFAVTQQPKWKGLNSAPSLPYELQWQQSNEGRFDFSFALPNGVSCFGLGERFSPLNLRSNVHTLISTDNPHHNEGADSLYKSIPFLILDKGGKCLGIFLDSPAPQRWDLDSDLSETALVELFTRRGWQLYLTAEGTLPQVVAAFTELTGRHALPPLWSLGHQQSRWSYPDEDTIRFIAQEYRKRKIPCDTVVMDIDYMDDYRVFTHSKQRFPSFNSLAKELGAQSFKLITIVDPGVKQDENYPLCKEAVARKLICYKPDGTPFTEKVWPGVCVFPDFVNPETRDWWGRKHEFYVDSGIAGIWNDMNEPAFFEDRKPLPTGMTEMPPMDQQRFTQLAPEGRVGHLEVRNVYGSMMSKATHDGLVALRPNERPFVLTRSGYAGLQRYTAVWLGDNMSWFEHLRKSIPMMLNVGLSGVAFAGCDIGGFGGNSDGELLVRWYETGIFYPFFRNHCALDGYAQEPWAFGPEAEKHVRKLIETRYRLLPYIQSLFWEHSRTGAPLMRPLTWHYPADPVVTNIDDQFMFGSDILVAPITERGKFQRSVYLPEGRWYMLEGDGKALEGGQLHLVSMPLGTVPAFVREGSIIPMAEVVQSTEQYATTPIGLHVFGSKARGKLILDDGISNDYQKGGYAEYEFEYANGAFFPTKQSSGYTPKHSFYFVAGKDRRPVTI
jgi:alpha-glucosidase